LQTLRDLVQFGATTFNAQSLFFGHGTDNATDEALALTAHVLNLAPDQAAQFPDARLTRSEIAAVYAVLRERVETRKPAAYLTHEAWFAGRAYYVDERVLVPRSPIAELIDNGFSPWLDADGVHRVLDLCCGSGCIGIACAHALPDAMVDLVDCDASALDVARINVERHGLQDRVHVVESDLYTQLAGQAYDLILCNPPYVNADDYAALPPEYRYEPEIGLVSGTDGLQHPLAVLTGAAEHLTPHGVLVLEVGASQSALEQALPRLDATWIEFERGGEGVALMTRSALLEQAELERAS
ncbi:MAG: 50S ribosomal protein L3 N(5)-glutamine methyltransferase, partial [Gammaproteobacteria bacterium]